MVINRARSSAAIKPARNAPYFMAYYRKGRVGTIHPSEVNFDRYRVAVLGRAKAHFTGPRRRRALICLLASAMIPLIGTDAFSNAAHKQVASHRNTAAKAENRKHPSPSEAKHSERAPRPRILLPSDLTSAGDVTPAPPLPPDLAAVKEAIGLIQQRKFSEATALATSINDRVAQKLVEWAYLRVLDSPAGFDRYNAFLKANPDWSSMPLRRRAEARLWQEQRDASTVRRFVGAQPATVAGRLAVARVLLAEGDRAGASR